MRKPLVGNGRVRLTTASYAHLPFDGPPAIEHGDAVVGIEGRGADPNEARLLHCALDDVQDLQAILRGEHEETEAVQSVSIQTRDAVSLDTPCVFCNEPLRSTPNTDNSVYILTQQCRGFGRRNACVHERCAASFAAALDTVWETPVPLLSQLL